MEIKKNESQINGNWIYDGKNVIEDEATKRINFLIASYLIKVATSSSGWEILYQDPKDQRLWELTYKQSELHGGGPPSLVNITFEDAKTKYPMG